MKRNHWNPKKVYEENFNWLGRSINFHYERPVEKLERYSNGENLESGYGSVMVSLSQLSTWYESHFVADAVRSKDSAGKWLNLSFQYDFSETQIKTAYWSTLETITFGEGLNDYIHRLSKGLSLGRFDDSRKLGEMFLKNIEHKGWFSEGRTTKLPPFVLGLFCKWQNLPFPKREFAEMPDFYRYLIENWNMANFAQLSSALVEACDFHIERSRDLTNKETFEFDLHFNRVYPAEILSVLRLRENAGLKNQTIEHPLMGLPTAKLFEPQTIKDELLENVIKKAVRDLGIKTS